MVFYYRGGQGGGYGCTWANVIVVVFTIVHNCLVGKFAIV